MNVLSAIVFFAEGLGAAIVLDRFPLGADRLPDRGLGSAFMIRHLGFNAKGYGVVCAPGEFRMYA